MSAPTIGASSSVSQPITARTRRGTERPWVCSSEIGDERATKSG